MLCCFVSAIEAVKQLLEIDEADEVFNVAENKTNFITIIFFRNYYFDLGPLQLHSSQIFSENFFKKFSVTLCVVSLEQRSVRSDSECLGNNNPI